MFYAKYINSIQSGIIWAGETIGTCSNRLMKYPSPLIGSYSYLKGISKEGWFSVCCELWSPGMPRQSFTVTGNRISRA